MSLADFLNKSKASAPKPFDPDASQKSDSIQVIYMNAPVNQGVLKFIPVTSLTNEEVSYLYDVMEFQVYTMNDDDEPQWRWGRVPQVKDFHSQLTQEQKDQVGRIQSRISALIEKGYGTDWARAGKNYALMFGYVLSHVNTEQEHLIDVKSRKLALLVLPSKNVAKAMTTMAESLLTSAAGEQHYAMLFNRTATDRKCYLKLSFKRGSGFGYDVVIQAKTFDLFSAEILTPEEAKVSSASIPQELIDLAKVHSATFMGNRETEEDFIPEYMDRLDEQISTELNKAIAKEQLPPKPELDGSANNPTNGWPTSN